MLSINLGALWKEKETVWHNGTFTFHNLFDTLENTNSLADREKEREWWVGKLLTKSSHFKFAANSLLLSVGFFNVFVSHFKQTALLWNWTESLNMFGKGKTKNRIILTKQSGRVPKNLTASRILQISIALCQIKAKIHSFPTMYIIGGGKFGLTRWKKCLKPKRSPKNSCFGGNESQLHNFGRV